MSASIFAWFITRSLFVLELIGYRFGFHRVS